MVGQFKRTKYDQQPYSIPNGKSNVGYNCYNIIRYNWHTW